MTDLPIKYCPFRVDDKGEYKTCYGSACMAYAEFDRTPINWTGCTEKVEPVKVDVCRRLNAGYPVYSGCSAI